MTFEELNDTFQKVFGATKLADLAQEFEVTPQVVSNWKTRNQVPYKYVLILRNKIKENKELNESQRTYFIERDISNNLDIHDSEDENELDILESIFGLYRIIVNNYKLIIFITFLSVSTTFVYVTYIAKPIYESTSKIMAKGSASKSKLGGIAGQLGVSLPVSSSDEYKLSEIFPDI